MLRINKSNNYNQLIVTLGELAQEAFPEYRLELFNFSTNVTYGWTGISPTQSTIRCDWVDLYLDEEVNNKLLTIGQYRYTFYEVIGTQSNIVEMGMLEVIETATQSYYQLPSDEDDDDFIVWNQ